MGEYSWGSTAGGGGGSGGVSGGEVVNANINSIVTYTVPAGKILIAQATSLSNTATLKINGDEVVRINTVAVKIFANSGDILLGSSTPSGSVIGITGMLYDV